MGVGGGRSFGGLGLVAVSGRTAQGGLGWVGVKRTFPRQQCCSSGGGDGVARACIGLGGCKERACRQRASSRTCPLERSAPLQPPQQHRRPSAPICPRPCTPPRNPLLDNNIWIQIQTTGPEPVQVEAERGGAGLAGAPPGPLRQPAHHEPARLCKPPHRARAAARRRRVPGAAGGRHDAGLIGRAGGACTMHNNAKHGFEAQPSPACATTPHHQRVATIPACLLLLPVPACASRPPPPATHTHTQLAARLPSLPNTTPDKEPPKPPTPL